MLLSGTDGCRGWAKAKEGKDGRDRGSGQDDLGPLLVGSLEKVKHLKACEAV